MAKKQRGKTRPSCPPEFRRRMVELVRGGRTAEALSREFEQAYYDRQTAPAEAAVVT